MPSVSDKRVFLDGGFIGYLISVESSYDSAIEDCTIQETSTLIKFRKYKTPTEYLFGICVPTIDIQKWRDRYTQNWAYSCEELFVEDSLKPLCLACILYIKEYRLDTANQIELQVTNVQFLSKPLYNLRFPKFVDMSVPCEKIETFRTKTYIEDYFADANAIFLNPGEAIMPISKQNKTQKIMVSKPNTKIIVQTEHKRKIDLDL